MCACVPAAGLTRCQVINLEPGAAYNIGAEEIIVNRTVVVIGNPLDRPLLNGLK
jgi:hypothetical protein